MLSNKILYYEDKSPDTTYGKTPSGQINVDRLIANVDYWKQINLTNAPKKKQLILTDFMLLYDKAEIQTQKKELLLKLFNKGFKIYFWYEDRLLLATNRMLQFLGERNPDQEWIINNIVPTPPETIIKAALAELKVPKDEIQLLDAYHLAILMNPELSKKYDDDIPIQPVATLSDIASVSKWGIDRGYHNITPQEIIEIMKKSYPGLKLRIDSNISIKNQLQLASQFENIALDIKYKELLIDGDDLHKLVTEGMFVDEGVTIKLTDLADLKTISLGHNSRPEDLIELEKHCPKLKSITSSRLQYKEIKNIPACASNIDEITFFIQVDAVHMSQMLSLYPNIKKLSYELCGIEGLMNWPKLPNLEDLEIHARAAGKENIINLLSSGLMNLKKLDISGMGVIDLLPAIVFPKLESLTLSQANSQPLGNIVKGAVNLKTLELKDCTLSDDIDWSSLGKLESIKLSKVTISKKNLESLVTYASKTLKEIDLSNCKISPDNTDEITWPKLPLLEKLKLDEIWSLFSTTNFALLLNNAINLKTLSLRSFVLNTEKDIGKSVLVQRNSLEYFDIIGAGIPPSCWEGLLRTSPKLQSLGIDTAKFNDFLTMRIPLPNLKELVISGADRIHSGFLFAFLNNYPHCKIINVRGVEKVDQILQGLKVPDVTIVKIKPSLKRQVGYEEDQDFDPNDFLNNKPDEDKPFRYKRQYSHLKNQAMIIEQLSQYMTVTRKNVESIPKLQNGICAALSELFLQKEVAEWDKMLKTIADWNGNSEYIPNEAKAVFDEILEKFIQVYLSLKIHEEYLGDNLESYIDKHPEKLLLSNIWHTIAIAPVKGTDNWYVYDPNYADGHRVYSKSNLLEVIDLSIGRLVTVATKADVIPVIDDPNSFINDGGLLILANCSNANEICKLLPKADQIQPFILGGILLRANTGSPAWLQGLQSSNSIVRNYAKDLLVHFIKNRPDSFATELVKSADALKNFERHACIGAIIDLCTIPELKPMVAQFDVVIKGLRMLERQEEYEKVFETWTKNKIKDESVDAFTQRLVRTPNTKHLIEVSSPTATRNLQAILHNYCQRISRPVFYVDSPDDLVCSAPYIQRNGDRGIFKKGPGGLLHDFLMAHQDKANPPVIIVNYDRFSANDIVRFNSLLDKERSADGTPVPEPAVVIGIMNVNNPDCYQGGDFYSRFDDTEACGLTEEAMQFHICPLPVKDEVDPNIKTANINLCNSTQWRERLLGQWVLRENGLFFQEGELVPALASGNPIVIENGLWTNEGFQSFWHDAIQKGYIKHAGRTITIPPDLQIIKREGYDWKKLLSKTRWSVNYTPNAEPLNQTLLNQFFSRYECNNVTKTLNHLDGLVKMHANKVLDINIARDISADEWASLLLECEKHNVQLHCHYPPTYVVPPFLQKELELPAPQATNNIPSSSDTAIIYSNDIDVTVAQKISDGAPWEVIDISSIEVSDLLKFIDSKLDKDKLIFEFTETTRYLLNALAEKKNVILKGSFSDTLADSLFPLLLQRFNSANNLGKLVLITSNPKTLNHLPSTTHQVTPAEKLKCLETTYKPEEINTMAAYAVKEPLCILQGRLAYKRAHGNENHSAAWAGLMQLPNRVATAPFDKANTAAKAAAFHQQRLKSVKDVLSHSPYVFLAGMTAVGKTTFIETKLAKDPDVTVRYGDTNVKAWALDKSNKLKILFIDEATLANRDWSEFEGLFNNPPGILIDGVYYPLDENHKVVFAGNPVSYGAGRRLANFFARHGNSIIYEPLTKEVIYEDVLRPIFINTPLEKQALEISEIFLKYYDFICRCSTTEVLISPRELQMMALLTLSNILNTPGSDPIAIANKHAHQIAGNLVPKESKTQFMATFGQNVVVNQAASSWNQAGFYMTPSRQVVNQQLNDLLALRHLRQNSMTELNDAQKYGGLGGLIIEGEPGTGKSELVISNLRNQGLKEGVDFIRIPVSMQTDEKIALLLDAFHKGMIVIIDEINSSPMIERLLNDLLMGRTPDNQRPKKPGFTIVGTQNSITMPGRRPPSNASARRFLKSEISPYLKNEMVDILHYLGLPEDETKPMVGAYEKKRTEAMENGHTPIPTFRDLERHAQQVIKSRKQVEMPPVPLKPPSELKRPVPALSDEDEPPHIKRKTEKPDKSQTVTQSLSSNIFNRKRPVNDPVIEKQNKPKTK